MADHILLETLVRRLEAGEPAVLATVIDAAGHAPRAPGAHMLILPDGRGEGTVGGGAVEAEILRAASAVFAARRARTMTFRLTPDAPLDLRCGGTMDILLELLVPDPAQIRLFARWRDARRAGDRGWIAAPLPGPGDHAPALDRAFLAAGETDRLAPDLAAALPAVRRPRILEAGGRRLFVEPAGTGGTVFVFGAGHVGRETAAVAARAGFRVVVVDDRPEFADAAQIPEADEVRVVPAFAGCIRAAELDADACVVIVTRGHRHDLAVLEQALGTDAGYLGMIGSRAKCAAAFAELAAKGVAADRLARVHAPIGLDLGADTPAEIAVSIVAELIRARAERTGGRRRGPA